MLCAGFISRGRGTGSLCSGLHCWIVWDYTCWHFDTVCEKMFETQPVIITRSHIWAWHCYSLYWTKGKLLQQSLLVQQNFFIAKLWMEIWCTQVEKKTIWAAISGGILLIPFLMRMFPHLCCLNWRWHDYLPFGKLPLTAVTRNKLCNTARWSGYICLSILNYIFSLHISTILSGWGDLIGSVLQCNKLTLRISGEKQIRVCKWCACLGSESESERDKEEMEE